MGQGTDSCGGDGYDYDDACAYEDSLAEGKWIQRNGTAIRLSDMTVGHLTRARIVAERAKGRASFSSDADLWEQWVEAFTDELATRNKKAQPKVQQPVAAVKVVAPQPTRGSKSNMKCHCGRFYLAREADLARGWAKSCSKSCAAIRRDFGRPAAVRVIG